MIDEEHTSNELVIDDELTAPPALNRHLASIALRILSNNLDDGYDIALSAILGGDPLTLTIGDAEIDVILDIRHFEIDVSFARCSATFGRDYDQFETGSLGIEEKTIERKSTLNTERNASLSISRKIEANLSGRLARDSNETQLHTSSEKHYPYRHIEIGCLSVGNINAVEPLFGNVVQDYVGWRIKPKTRTARSGAVARLRVKRNWIQMREPSVRSGMSQIADRLRRTFGGESNSERLKSAAFPILLEKLVHLKLQDPNEREFATLAAAVAAVKPNSDDELIIPVRNRKQPLQVDLSVIENFLDLEDEQIETFLEQIEHMTKYDHEKDSQNGKFSNNIHDESQDNITISYEIPELGPETLLSVLQEAHSQFLISTENIDISRFHDEEAVEYLQKIGLFILKDGKVSGIDMDADANLAEVLAERVINLPDMQRVFKAYALLPSLGYKPSAPPSDRLSIVAVNSTSSLVAALFETDDTSSYSSTDEAVLEANLYDWCEFARYQLNIRDF